MNPARTRAFRSARYLILALSIAVGVSAPTQQPPVSAPVAEKGVGARIQFDVISIRKNLSGDRKMSHSFPRDGDGMTFTNTPLFMIILFSYNYNRPESVSGLPDWAMIERYDVQVKVDVTKVQAYRSLGLDDRRAMLRDALSKIIQLRAHFAEKEMAVYNIEISSKGCKMQASNQVSGNQEGPKPAGGQTIVATSKGHLVGKRATVSDLALALSDMGLERPVIDNTGLTQKFDFELTWDPAAASPQANAESSNQGPTIFQAIQDRLGLILKPSRASIQTLAIDHIEKPPSDF